MKALLIVAGLGLLAVALASAVGAVLMFLQARRRPLTPVAAGASTSPSPQPPPAHPRPQPPPPPIADTRPMILPPIEPIKRAATPSPDATLENQPTIVVPLKGAAPFGQLVWLSGPLQGRTTPVPATGARIGRDASSAEIIVNAASVSKCHAWVGPRDGKIVIEDNGSTNGTYLQASRERVREKALNHGDVVIIANDAARFRFEIA